MTLGKRMTETCSALCAKTNYVTRFGVTQQKSGLRAMPIVTQRIAGPRRLVARWTVARIEHELSLGRYC
jgi:hypothetical protein